MSEHDHDDNTELVHTGHDDPGDALVELALGTLTEPRHSELVGQVCACSGCRVAYDRIVDGIDVVLPAAPVTSPPAGFDVRVLDALGVEAARSVTQVRDLRPHRTRNLLAAAAVLLVVALGGGAAIGAWVAQERGDEDPSGFQAGSSALVKDDGELVGEATVGWLNADRVLVLSVNKPAMGVSYHCRVRVEGKKPQVVYRWQASSPEGGTFVVPTPPGKVTSIEMVTDSGNVWATAHLPG